MNPASLLCLTESAQRLPLVSQGNGFSVSVDLPAGIYRFDATLDASRVDWERFYLSMHSFGNNGQRTGVWDFDFDGVRPLLPAWWVNTNGRKLGLAMVQRVSPDEIAHRRLTMSFCVESPVEGPLVLSLEPYNQFDLSWLECRLAPERLDVPVPFLPSATVPQPNLARHQVEAGVLQAWSAKLDRDSPWLVVFDRAVRSAKASSSPELLPLLAFAALHRNDAEAKAQVLAAIKTLIDLEHWGNPLPDGYGCDGDMGVAAIIEPFSFVLQWLREDLQSANLYEPALEKLLLQMDRFYEGILLWSAYWGGSLLQDHGHRSLSRFATAAFNLLGETPDACRWLALAVARLDRVLQLLPSDGAVPVSSHSKIHLYLDDFVNYRDALLHATGRDIFDGPLWDKVIQFVANRLHEPTMQVLGASPGGDRRDFYAGWGVFSLLATRNQGAICARLTELLRDRYREREIPLRPAATILAAIAHESGVAPLPLAPAVFDARWESGQILYRPAPEVAVCIRCQPPGGSIAGAARLTNRCDLAMDAPLEGHFTVASGPHTLLQTAEGGYRMRSSLGNVLLIDGKGAYGDVDNAMGVPGVSWRGERIECANYDQHNGNAYVRLILGPAYPREAGVLHYTREFFMRPDGLLCRDVVLCQEAHEFSWHFQTFARRTVEVTGENRFRISEGDSSLSVHASALETGLRTSRDSTDVVWAYGNENESQPFQHVRFSTATKVAALTVEFRVDWTES